MATYGYTFTSGDTVTPTKLNTARTITEIVNADIKSNAAIAGTKVAPDFGAQNVVTTGTVTAGKLVPSGTSATGNGLYLPAANTVAVSTNGGERLRVDATGNAAIGTTTTAAAKLTVADASANDALRITQTGTGNALVVEDVATDGSPTVIDASGNVTIGHTSAPTVASAVHPLNVVGAGAAIARAAADALGAAITFVKSRSTGIGGTRAIVLNNDELGIIEFAADNGANLNTVGASIAAECDGTAGSADMPARIVFRTTADGAASPTERMRITNAGNVGIGKTPTTALDVNGTVTATAFVGPITGDVTGTASAIADSTVTNSKVAAGAAIAHNKLANITAGQVLLGNASSVPTATALSGDVTINSSGVTAIGSGVIVNADVSAAAGIDHNKLANITAGQVLMGNATNVPTATALSGDVTVSSSGVTAIGSGVIVNADISATADIAHTKLADITAGRVLMGNATNVPTATALSGDVTISSSGVTAIGSGVIVNADISATAEIALSKLAAGALPTDITVASSNLVNGTIVNEDVNASAAIAGTKVSPDFGSQNAVTTGNVTAAKLIPTGTSAVGNGMYLPAANSVGISTNGSERLRINSSGFLLFGSSGSDVNASVTGYKVDPSGQFVVSRGAASGSLADFHRPDDGVVQYFVRNGSIVGSISVATGATTYATSSDYRLKEDVQPLAGGLATVEAMSPRKYKWKDGGKDAVGFIAHELQSVVPDAVTGEKDAVDASGNMVPQGVDASKLIPHLVAAVQELSARVKELEGKDS